MESIICDNCGQKNFENAKNCRSCLQVLGLKELTKKSDDSIFLQTEFNKVPEPTDYQRPEEYEETTGYWQRLRLVIWDRDIHTIKELSHREDLQDEATNSLFIIVSLMSIFTIIDWSLNQDITISFPLFVIGVFILVFSNSYLFIFLFVYLGRMWSRSSNTMDRNFVFRPVTYVFALRALEGFLLLLANTTNNGFVGLFWFMILIYSIIVSISVFGKIFDTKLYIGIITVIFAFLISFNLSRLLLTLVFNTINFLNTII
ncbi:MAG: hypothetical protein GPJ54_09890 [Candidatus Heimdallarchaeota archaeon]|nr:hypothetical protein [Candidatus Heimdallarchaeota archaeon]